MDDYESSSSELMPRALDIDVEDSDAQEAIQYLISVRTQARNAPSYTECKTSVNTKSPDEKYIPQSQLSGHITLQTSPWENEAY